MSWKKIIGIGIGVIIVLIIALLWIIPNFINLESLKPKIEAQAKKALKRELALQGLKLQLFPTLGVELSGVKIANLPSFSQEPLLEADHIDVKISLLHLLKKEIKIKKIVLIRPKILLIRNPEGELSIADLYRKSKEKGTQEKVAKESKSLEFGGKKVTIDSVQIKDGIFSFDDFKPPAGGRYVSIEMADFDFLLKKFSLTEKMNLDLAFKFQSEAGQNFHLKGELGPLGEKLEWQKAPADLSLEISQFELGQIVPYFAEKLPVEILSGKLSSKLEVRAEKPGTAVKGLIGLDEFAFLDKKRSWMPSPKTRLDLNLDALVNLPEKKYLINSSRLAVGKSVIDLSGQRANAADQFKFNSNNLDLAELAELVYPLKKFIADRKINLSGTALLSGTFQSASPAVLQASLDLKNAGLNYPGALTKPAGDKLAIDLRTRQADTGWLIENMKLGFNGGEILGKGNLSKDNNINLDLAGSDVSMEELTKLVTPLSRYNFKGKMDLDGNLSGKVTQAQNLNFLINQLTMKGPDLDLALTGMVNNLVEPRIKFDLNGQKLNAAGLMKSGGKKAESEQEPKTSEPAEKPSGKKKGEKEDKKKEPGILEKIYLEGQIRLAQLGYQQYQAQNFSSNFLMENGVASLPDTNFNIFQGTASGPISIDLSGKKLQYQGNLALAGVELPEALKNFTKLSDQITGKLDGNLEFSGRGTSWNEIKSKLNGKGKMSVTKGSLKAFNLVGNLLGDWANSKQFRTLVNGKVGKSNWQSLKQTEFNLAELAFAVKDGGIELNDLNLLIPDGTVKGKGRVGFDSRLKLDGELFMGEGASKKIAKELGLSPEFTKLLFKDGKNLLLPFNLGGNFPGLQAVIDPVKYGEMIARNLTGSAGKNLGLPGGDFQKKGEKELEKLLNQFKPK